MSKLADTAQNSISHIVCPLVGLNLSLLKVFNVKLLCVVKVAEHSFQVPMPNSPLLLCFGARFLHESRLTVEGFILVFLAKVCTVSMATGLVKNKAKKWFLFI